MDKIKCKICGKKFKTITNTHLKKHNITVNKYIEKYGNIISEKTRKKFSENCYFRKKKGKTLEELYGEEKAKIIKYNCAWNRGLTKHTDNRVKKQSINVSKTMKKEEFNKIFRKKIKESFTPERKKNISKKMLEKWKDDNYRKQLVEAHKGYVWSEESKKKLSDSNKGKKNSLQHIKKIKESLKNSNFDFSLHGKKIQEKLKNNKKRYIEYKSKTLGFCKGHSKPSYKELQLRNKVCNLFDNVLYTTDTKRLIIKTKKSLKYPDILIEDQKLIIEYDGIQWHKLENDKKRDKELIDVGYKILHYQGFIPSEDELREDVKDLVFSNNNIKYRRFGIDITKNITNINHYEELEKQIA